MYTQNKQSNMDENASSRKRWKWWKWLLNMSKKKRWKVSCLIKEGKDIKKWDNRKCWPRMDAIPSCILTHLPVPSGGCRSHKGVVCSCPVWRGLWRWPQAWGTCPSRGPQLDQYWTHHSSKLDSLETVENVIIFIIFYSFLQYNIKYNYTRNLSVLGQLYNWQNCYTFRMTTVILDEIVQHGWLVYVWHVISASLVY